jgi:hypothetical protein
MWDPLLRKELSDCALLGAQVVEGRHAIYCILAPPRYAIGEEKYAAAQRTINKLLPELPHSVIGLQNELWRAYLSGNTLSIAPAVEGFEEKPDVISLEKDIDARSFEDQKAAAITSMACVRPFLDAMLDGWASVARRCSPAFAELWRAVDRSAADNEGLTAKARDLARRAEVAGCSVPVELELALRMTRDAAGLSDELVRWELNMIERDIAARGKAHAFSNRSALELYLYRLRDRSGHDERYRDTIVFATELLAEAEPAVDAGVIAEVADLLTDRMGDVLVEAVKIKADEQHLRPRGMPERASRLLEIAPLLDIDVNRYPALKLYVYYGNASFDLDARSNSAIWMRVADSIDRLEGDLLTKMVSGPRELALVNVRAALKMMRELRLQHMGYDDADRAALATFSADDLLDQLHLCDVALPVDIEAQASAVDQAMADIYSFLDRTMVRGAQLARSILREMQDRDLETFLVVFDGYLRGAVAGALGSEVSYSMLTPSLR